MSAEDLPLKLRAMRERPAVTRSRAPIVIESLTTLAVREQVQERLLSCLEPLREMTRTLRPVQRMDSGCWRIGLAQQLEADQRKGRAARPYSRCEFTLAFDTIRRRLDIECHATACDRDLLVATEVHSGQFTPRPSREAQRKSCGPNRREMRPQ